jgi:hypothetical protein
MQFSSLSSAALAVAIVGTTLLTANPAPAGTTLTTVDMQLNFGKSSSNFGLQAVDRTNNAVLLTQSSLSFNGLVNLRMQS